MTRRGDGGAADSGAPQYRQGGGLGEALASTRLTLWLLAILAVAMAVATVIPQRAPGEAYLKAFGTALGPLIARTTLHNIYGSWWFIGTFALLAVNLLMCSVRRARGILLRDLTGGERPRSEGELPGPQTRWRIAHETDAAADRLGAVLRRAGYSVVGLAAGDNGERSLTGRKGRLSLWAPVIVHVGIVIILIGAAWGRFPGSKRLGLASHSYREKAMLVPGEVFAVKPPGEAFGLRLDDAGVEHSASGQPKRFWAKVAVLEEGQVIESQTVEPNRPLRYHGVSVTLASIGAIPSQMTMPTGAWEVKVTGPHSSGTVPIVLSPEGVLDMMASSLRLDDPPWLIFVARFQQSDQAGHAMPTAHVFLDRSGQPSHNFEAVGWVGSAGLDYQGLHFHLVPGDAKAPHSAMAGGQPYAELNLDRDIGVPIVYFGFALVSLGTIFMLGPPHRRVTAWVRAGGKGSRVAVSVSPGSDRREAERIGERIESDLGGVREVASPREREAASPGRSAS